MKPELGVCYYPEHWPEEMWADDARRMVEMGLSWVRIGEFAWSKIEPKEGQFDWGWLDRAVEVLANAGLKIVMGTPTATPPKWVLNKYPDMLAVDAQGRPRKFGSRRHYCFSHLGYRKEASRIAYQMGARYGAHKAIQAWQTDNEYGCHETTVSYSDAARAGFQDWLAQKDQSPDALNRAWGNVFWSMEYDAFSEIDLPNLTVTEPNPAHVLDFRRYASSEVFAFNRAQVDAFRPHTSVPLIRNYMGRVTDFDHFGVGSDLEIASWDSYPMGFLEQVLEDPDDWKARFAQQGDPDFQAFHHDLYRAVGKGRWWVMEQQPGPVNWAPWNPIPLDGMVRLWTWEAIAHGAEVVSYFRWRQAPFAQEQMHAGLLRPDSVEARASIEAKQVANEIAEFGEIEHKDADVAIVFDYQSQWAWEAQPQGQDFDYFRLVFDQYRALRRLGLSVDILPADTHDFGNRKLVLIPGLMSWNDQLLGAIKDFKGSVLAGPRTGSKDDNMWIPTPMPPNMPDVDALISRVASMRPQSKIELEKGGFAHKWLEEIEAKDVLEHGKDGSPILIGTHHRAYLGAWLDDEAMLRVVKEFATAVNLATTEMPEGVRKRQMGDREIVINYNSDEVQFLGIKIPAADVEFRVL